MTSGGDCPGINATIRGVCKTAISHYGMEVYGIHSGFRGLLDNDITPLTEKDLTGLLNMGGTILGTSREKPFKKRSATSQNKPALMLKTIKDVGPGGHYLEERSTLKNFKKIWYPKRFKRLMENPDESDLMDRLIAEVDHILETHVPKPITQEQEEVLASYEAEFMSRYQ